MLGILLFCIGVMYTPGPVNLLSLNRGAQGGVKSHLQFCIGVGGALFLWFLLIGYTGSAIITHTTMPLISTLGCLFIIYLAFKVISSDATASGGTGTTKGLTFRDGFLLQLLNPKSFLVVLPVTTVQFPAAGIDGAAIIVWSAGLGLLGVGAPLAYAVAGASLLRQVARPHLLKRFNVAMGILLIAVALDIAYHHIYLAVWA